MLIKTWTIETSNDVITVKKKDGAIMVDRLFPSASLTETEAEELIFAISDTIGQDDVGVFSIKDDALLRFTNKQRHALTLLAGGMSVKRIADDLLISTDSVRDRLWGASTRIFGSRKPIPEIRKWAKENVR